MQMVIILYILEKTNHLKYILCMFFDNFMQVYGRFLP